MGAGGGDAGRAYCTAAPTAVRAGTAAAMTVRRGHMSTCCMSQPARPTLCNLKARRRPRGRRPYETRKPLTVSINEFKKVVPLPKKIATCWHRYNRQAGCPSC
ncbi:hypothetical protein EVAR_3048_1 [Eumeta japonica]|uniref:Uncharacterized protein n=1 Tax=Eumeta variegata TaxID=151549 RepID=A0A4C1SWK9_EUMVA|nr:hypothetical protein EVAR_3048_1 [Eumeta japonica]